MGSSLLEVIIACALTAVFGLLISWQNAKMAKKLKTNHGKTIGEHVEDLVTWSHIHTEQDNEIRTALGLPPAKYPDLTAWKNER